MRKRPTRRERRTQAAYFEIDGQKLFVPTEQMWHLHEAGKPRATYEAAGVDRAVWYRWRETYGESHWLFRGGNPDAPKPGWLYHGAAVGVKVVPPANQRNGRAAVDGEFFATPEMVRFRRQSGHRRLATRAAEAAKAEQRASRAASREATITPGLIFYWLPRYKHLPWFESWLCYGADAPADVRVVSLRELQRIRRAWDWRAHQAPDERIYAGWWRSFPADRLFEFVWWLFGGETPSRWFIVPESIDKLKRRLSAAGVCDKAGVWLNTYENWQAEPAQRRALQDMVEAARSGKKLPPANSAACSELFGVQGITLAARSKMKRAMIAYAEKSVFKAALNDAGLSPAAWHGHCEEAAKRVGPDARAALENWVREERGRRAWTGVIGPGLFNPPESMRRFREAARKCSSKELVSALRNQLPAGCFIRWMLDWTKPAGIDGDASPAVSANAPASNGTPCASGDARLTAALALCKSDNQRNQVKAINMLTSGRPDYWPVADAIAHAAGIAFNNNVHRSLAQLVARGALSKRPKRNGYRLA